MAVGVKKGHIRKLSISISEASADWVEAQILDYKYRNISHAIETLIREKMTASESK
jgi:Arc/MetJ-type ribon-helix-helix transcriptional regulator